MAHRSHRGALAALLVAAILGVCAVDLGSAGTLAAVDRGATGDGLTTNHPADAGLATRPLRVPTPCTTLGSATGAGPLASAAPRLVPSAGDPHCGAPLYTLLRVYRL